MTPKTDSCRVCGVLLGMPSFLSPGPSITSISTSLLIDTSVSLCDGCGHVQSPELPDIRSFYASDYRISLQSDGHDQLYEIKNGQNIYRTDHQATLINRLKLPESPRVLDYGAAKASTLEKLFLLKNRDFSPYVYDVSPDYKEYWDRWIPKTNQFVNEIPSIYQGSFDLVTAHFVLEHVSDPVDVLRNLQSLLSKSGKLFWSVPNAITNSGDLLVVDHVNHFTKSSIQRACSKSNLHVEKIDDSAFRGAFAMVCTANKSHSDKKETEVDDKELIQINDNLKFWSQSLEGVSKNDKILSEDKRIAVYGAGFYGSLAVTKLGLNPVCFLDRNVHIQNTWHMGINVLSPEDCPDDVEVIIIGLNPSISKGLIRGNEEWMPEQVKLVYF